MKDNFKLIAITIVFVFAGLALSFISWQDVDLDSSNVCLYDGVTFAVEQEVVGYQKDNHCVCSEGGIIECIPLEMEDEVYDAQKEEVIVLVDDFKNDNLKFEYRYLTGIGEENGDSFSNTSFSDISIVDESLVVVLEEMQICPSTNVVSDQEGFYYEEDGVIKLYSKVEKTEGISCVVELKYVLEDFKGFDLEKMQIVFVNEQGLETYASTCIYGDRIYSDNDVFRATEDSICTCEGGEVTCEEELSD
jgi:hypothetical protein